jgi:hypothetical protein
MNVEMKLQLNVQGPYAALLRLHEFFGRGNLTEVAGMKVLGLVASEMLSADLLIGELDALRAIQKLRRGLWRITRVCRKYSKTAHKAQAWDGVVDTTDAIDALLAEPTVEQKLDIFLAERVIPSSREVTRSEQMAAATWMAVRAVQPWPLRGRAVVELLARDRGTQSSRVAVSRTAALREVLTQSIEMYKAGLLDAATLPRCIKAPQKRHLNRSMTKTILGISLLLASVGLQHAELEDIAIDAAARCIDEGRAALQPYRSRKRAASRYTAHA